MARNILPFTAIVILGALGELILYVGPVLLGAAVDAFDFSPGDAGYIVAGEFGLSAIAAIYLSSRRKLANVKRIVLASTLLLIACDGISFITTSPTVFVFCRLVVAFGAGTLFAIGNAAAAVQEKPQRIFSIMIFIAVLFSAFVYTLAPLSIETFGPRGPFGVLVLISFVLLPFIPFLPDLQDKRSNTEGKRSERTLSLVGLISLAAIFLLYTSQSGLWAYVERIGQSLELSIEVISVVLTLNAVLGLGAGILAGIIGVRFGAFLPITIALAAQIVAAFFLPLSFDATTYGVSAIMFTFALIFVVPYFKVLLAKVDPSGRTAGMGTAFITLGSAFGPAVMGYSLNPGANYQGIALLTCVGLAMAWILAVLVVRNHSI